jgi:hypothetical protein
MLIILIILTCLLYINYINYIYFIYYIFIISLILIKFLYFLAFPNSCPNLNYKGRFAAPGAAPKEGSGKKRQIRPGVRYYKSKATMVTPSSPSPYFPNR